MEQAEREANELILGAEERRLWATVYAGALSAHIASGAGPCFAEESALGHADAAVSAYRERWGE
jgi:hypothetical protein